MTNKMTNGRQPALAGHTYDRIVARIMGKAMGKIASVNQARTGPSKFMETLMINRQGDKRRVCHTLVRQRRTLLLHLLVLVGHLDTLKFLPEICD